MTIDEKLDFILSNMATKDDIQRLDDKINSLDKKMDSMEHDILNTCLGYTDEQNETIITKLDNIQSTVNTAAKIKTIDNSVYEIINKRFEKVQKEIDEIKIMIS